jgi:peroxiredoxin
MLALILPLLTLAACTFWASNSEEPLDSIDEPEIGIQVGQIAPDFTLNSTRGLSFRLSQYRGQPVLLNFFATWCGPCRSEMPAVQRVYARYRPQGLAILAVDLNEGAEPVSNLGRELKLTYPLLLDYNGKIADSYGARSIPRSFFIDANGIIRTVRVGSLDEDQITEAVDNLMIYAYQPPEPTAAAPVPEAQETQPQTVVGIEGCVNIRAACVRSGPGKDYLCVSNLALNTCVPFDARTADSLWLRLNRPGSDGNQAWIASEFITLNGEINGLPVSE